MDEIASQEPNRWNARLCLPETPSAVWVHTVKPRRVCSGTDFHLMRIRGADVPSAAHLGRRFRPRLIQPDASTGSAFSAIECAQRLGGMLRFYFRPAA